MSEKKNSTITLNLSQILKEKSFDSFNDLRKESHTIIKEYREAFMRIACKRFDIVYPNEIRKRDLVALMEKHNAGIVNNERLNRDELVINGEAVAYWSRDYKIEFSKGSLVCKINFFIKG